MVFDAPFFEGEAEVKMAPDDVPVIVFRGATLIWEQRPPSPMPTARQAAVDMLLGAVWVPEDDPTTELIFQRRREPRRHLVIMNKQRTEAFGEVDVDDSGVLSFGDGLFCGRTGRVSRICTGSFRQRLTPYSKLT